MLKVDVSKLLEKVGNVERFDQSYDLELVEKDYQFQKPIELELQLLSTGESIVVQGNISGKYTAVCNRCLKEYPVDINIEIEEEYRKVTTMEQDSKMIEVELGEEDFILAIDDEGYIDLEELIRQNILVNMPIQLICREACPGLPQMADNKEAKTDPRWDNLRNLQK
jgi:DUF177 domain-containing protein